jgi:hypothetical protein
MWNTNTELQQSYQSLEEIRIVHNRALRESPHQSILPHKQDRKSTSHIENPWMLPEGKSFLISFRLHAPVKLWDIQLCSAIHCELNRQEEALLYGEHNLYLLTMGININLSQFYKACEPKGISEALHVTMRIISSWCSCNFLNLQMRPLTYVPDTMKIASQCPPFHKSDTPTSNNEYNKIKCLLNMWVELDGVVMTVNRQLAGWSRVQFLSVTRDFSLLHNAKTSSGAHPTSYSMGIVGILHEGTGVGAWSWRLISKQ